MKWPRTNRAAKEILVDKAGRIMSMKVVRSEHGMAALVALVMVGMLTLLGLAALSSSDDEVKISGNQMQETRAFYASEAGLEKATASIQSTFELTGVPPTDMPVGTDSINSCAVNYTTRDNGPATQQVLTSGTLAGLHALVKSFTVTSTGASAVDRAKVVLSQSFETDLIPLFQFAVFYGTDLEVAPGPQMTLLGRVHSNGNLYIQSDNALRLDSYVTASGHIIHGPKASGKTVGTGDVLIKNAAGAYTSMKLGSGWLDGTYSKWYDSSIARWNGRVQDVSHGQGPLNLPLTNSSDPHKLIEPATGNPDSYENKATLKFVNGKALSLESGIWVDHTADMLAKGIIKYTADQYTDAREGKKVDCTELDVSLLYDNTKGPYAGISYAPVNGVVYFSDNIGGPSEWPGLRIKNGAEIKSTITTQNTNGGLTIASQNPVYTQGDYNKTNKKPAAIMADAITFLSVTWNDANSAGAKATRVAGNTTVNCSYVTGNVATVGAAYSGGFENLPRFLETWYGKTFTWTGSAVNLWTSRQATGSWNGTYYDPPNRVWSYDTDLDNPNKLPPETPVVRVFQRNGWEQSYVDYNGH